MVRIPKEEIEKIKSEADIVQVISHYIPVEPKGTDTFKAVCPFHNDHDPSLHISKTRNDFKCFVCDTYGDAFEFVKLYEKVQFPKAVEKVANIIGHQLSVDVDERSTFQKDPHIEHLQMIMKDAVAFLNVQLVTQDGANAYRYLHERSMSDEIISTFEIGYNPTNDALYHHLKNKGYEDSDLVELNLVNVSSNGLKDVFNDRVTIPIYDPYGYPIGFTARRLNPNVSSKYINTKATPLFQKGELLYNAHHAKDAARKSGKLYVTEGVFDVIAFARAGMMNCVCTLGTACTDSQINLMKSLSSTIVFCYDSDSAGQRAILKAGRKAIMQGATVLVIDNRMGKDPDEIITRDGKDALYQLLEHEVDWPKFAIDYHRKQADLSTFNGKMEFQKNAMSEVNLLRDERAIQHFANYVEEITNIPVVALPNIQPRNQEVVKPLPTVDVRNGASIAEELIVGMMIESKKACDLYDQELGFLYHDYAFCVAMAIQNQWRMNGTCSLNQLMDEAEDMNQKQLIQSAVKSVSFVEENKEEVMRGAIRRIRIEIDRQALLQANQRLSMGNGEDEGQLLKEIDQLSKRIRGYMSEENN